MDVLFDEHLFLTFRTRILDGCIGISSIVLLVGAIPSSVWHTSYSEWISIDILLGLIASLLARPDALQDVSKAFEVLFHVLNGIQGDSLEIFISSTIAS